MKPASDHPAGEVVEKTTRTRIIPAAEDAKLDLWQTLYALAANPTEWDRHMLYIYRIEPSGASTPITKGKQMVQMPITLKQVAVADKEELEFALRDVSGGNYRIILKDGPQIKVATTVQINAPVRPVIEIESGRPAGASPTTATPAYGIDPTASVAGRAFDALRDQERTGAEIGFQAMRTAADVMQRFGNGPSSDSETTVLLKELLAELRASRSSGMNVQQILATITSGVAILKELGVIGGGGNPVIQKLLDLAMERVINPAPTGAPVSASAELVRSLPQIGGQFVEGVKAWADARKAELQMMTMSRTSGTTTAPGATLLPPAPTAPAAHPTPPANNGAAPVSHEFVFRKVVEIFQRPISAHEAADAAMEFLSELDPSANGELAKLGEEGLLQFFYANPILKAATNNPQRLLEFIRAFLKMHAEDVATEAAEQAATPAAPVTPNKEPLLH